MKKLSLLVAGVAIVLAGCGGKDEAVTPETTDQAAQETAVADAVVAESQPVESPGMTAAQVTAEEAVSEVVASVTETGAAVSEAASQQVAAVTGAAATIAEQAPAATAAEPDLVQGKKIYSKNCFACHGSGAAGAPKLGDSENWAPRIAKGMETLAQNAIAGFKGSAGYMPPKGGFMTLGDADVTAAVAYMVDESR
jgi:cytochrome c5